MKVISRFAFGPVLFFAFSGSTLGSPRWAADPTDADPREMKEIMSQLPKLVSCIRSGKVKPCGLTDDDGEYLSGFSIERRRTLFADGRIAIHHDSEDVLAVFFLSGESRHSGVVKFVRRGGRLSASGVSVLVVD